jgi:hypothetical protein
VLLLVIMGLKKKPAKFIGVEGHFVVIHSIA